MFALWATSPNYTIFTSRLLVFSVSGHTLKGNPMPFSVGMGYFTVLFCFNTLFFPLCFRSCPLKTGILLAAKCKYIFFLKWYLLLSCNSSNLLVFMVPISHCCLFEVWLNKCSRSVSLPLHTVVLSSIVQHLTNCLGNRLNPIRAATTLYLKS